MYSSVNSKIPMGKSTWIGSMLLGAMMCITLVGVMHCITFMDIQYIHSLKGRGFLGRRWILLINMMMLLIVHPTICMACVEYVSGYELLLQIGLTALTSFIHLYLVLDMKRCSTVCRTLTAAETGPTADCDIHHADEQGEEACHVAGVPATVAHGGDESVLKQNSVNQESKASERFGVDVAGVAAEME